jgi:thioredoxin 1
VAQINVDDYPEIAGAYGVQSIPNMILFKDGEAASQLIGFMPKDALMAKLAPELD